jgi:transposase
VGPIAALTWALEIGDVSRFRTIKHAISFCGLCGDERSSADKAMRTPLSKQRNKHIQRTLVEAGAKAEQRTGCDLRAGKAKRKWQSGDTRRSPERWLPICLPWIGNRETLSLLKNAGLWQPEGCR